MSERQRLLSSPAYSPVSAHPKLSLEHGRPLPTQVRAVMEPRFGFDFSQVRIHHDDTAAILATALDAQAVTIGHNIAFARGQYAPDSTAGRRLIAHELAHVVQQSQDQDGSRQVLEDRAETTARAALARRALPGPRPAATTLPEPLHPQPFCYSVPGSLRCNQLADWLSRNSPYLPDWAETRCEYTFVGEANVRFTTARGGSVTAQVRGNPRADVTVDCPIDRPEWEPTDRPNRDAELAAWNAAMTRLGAHERQHRSIGQSWRQILAQRYQSVSFSVTGADQAEATSAAAERLNDLKDQWGASAQAAQSAIDPFSVNIACPPAAAPRPQTEGDQP